MQFAHVRHPPAPLASVVVPAHNEEPVIERCLRAMTRDSEPGELEIVVACNGCTDRTAELARRFGGLVKVVETARASKAAGLNLGDEAATAFPRFYVDADIELSIDAIRKVARVLRDGPALAAAPRMLVDARGRPWRVRAYYDVWTRLGFFDQGMIGSGVYAVAEAGRQRWGRFPEVIADDGYVHRLFAPHERMTVSSCSFAIRPPATLRGLVKIFTRVRAGTYELRERFPELHRGVAYGQSLRRVVREPAVWPSVPVYAMVVCWTKWRGRRRARAGGPTGWTPERSSRTT